jgi:hypothetical protein
MRKKEHGVTKRASRSVADGAERVRLITWQVYLMAMNAQHIHGCWATLDRMDSPLCSDRCFLNTHQAAVACIYLTERGRERMGKSSQRVGRPERPPWLRRNLRWIHATPRLVRSPKSKSHAHPARGWSWWTSIYRVRGWRREANRACVLLDAIDIMESRLLVSGKKTTCNHQLLWFDRWRRMSCLVINAIQTNPINSRLTGE